MVRTNKANKTTKTVIAQVFNNTNKSLAEIESMMIVGIHVNNWMMRSVELHKDIESESMVYSIGRTFDGARIVLSHDDLRMCRDFRTAIDYWAHGNKVYTTD